MPAIAGAGFALIVVGNAIAPADHRAFFVSAAALAYVAAASLVAFHARRLPPLPFGAANAVTLVRMTIACGFAAYAASLVAGHVRHEIFAAGAAVLGLAFLFLDGLDGWLARRLGIASAFGARFDMEVDAFFILILSIVAWASGKAGAWVFLIGAARYMYVAAGQFWPVLRRPLFPSQRRKAIAAIQIGVLTVVIAPKIAPPLSETLAAGALVLLLYSFAADIRWQVEARMRLLPNDRTCNEFS